MGWSKFGSKRDKRAGDDSPRAPSMISAMCVKALGRSLAAGGVRPKNLADRHTEPRSGRESAEGGAQFAAFLSVGSYLLNANSH